jgi:hypothetical protein
MGLKTLFECCACDDTAAVWTIRLTPNGVEDRGRRYLNPEFEEIDRLFYRTLRGEDVSALAAPEVASALQEVLKRSCRLNEGSYSLGMINGWRTVHKDNESVFSLSIDLDFTFRIGSRNGRPFVLEMSSPDSAVVRFLAAVRAKLDRQGFCVYCGTKQDRRAAADAVLRERPDLALPASLVEALVAKPIPELCEDAPWPWLLPGERLSSAADQRRSRRMSPTRVVTPVRSHQSRSAIANFRDAPIRSRKTAAETSPCARQCSATRRFASSTAARA